jgi:hypothetical protein
MEAASNHEASEIPSPFVPVSEIPVDQLPIVYIKKSRRDALEICGTKRANGSSGTPENHMMGIKGEYAVAKFYGDPDGVDTAVDKSSDGGVDLDILGDIQVKTCGSQVNNPKLMISDTENLHADHYVLVQELDRSSYRIIGYAPKQTVANAPVSRFATIDEPVRVIEQPDLWQPPRPILSKETPG